MSQQEIKIKAEFPEWNNLSRQVPSLISFYEDIVSTQKKII